MKISEVTIQDLMEYARETDESGETLKSFALILASAKSYIKSYTGLSADQLDEKEDLTIALFVLATEMYENRVYTETGVKQSSVNKVVESILNMHSINLL